MNTQEAKASLTLSNNLSSPQCSIIPPSSHKFTILDSGCTGHYFPPNYPITDATPTVASECLNVTLPDSSKITSTHVAHIPIPTLPPQATKTYIFPGLQFALLSVGQLCDCNCTVHFSKQTVKIFNADNTLISTGTRDPHTELWKIPLPISQSPTPLSLQANGIIKRNTLISDLCQFLHASLFNPTLSTLESAIKSVFLESSPGLTLKTIRKYLPSNPATSKGHMTQEQKGIMSTKPNNINSPLDPVGERTGNFMCNVIELPTGNTFSDQTGKFPCISSRGFKYIFVMYDYDSNSILSEPIKNRT